MKKNILNKLARQIIKYRKDLGMTQEDLSKKTGISRSSIAMIETAKRDITISNLSKIAKALNISLSELTKF
ncbi:helix-turn-helix transcriptional regulator [bacterium]|nr:helix-turn-helix transcriptional regulator [bacterium]